MKVREVLVAASCALKEAGIDGPEQDARILLARAMGIGRDRLTLYLNDDLAPDMAPTYPHMIAQRIFNRPVSRILQGRWFYDRWFEISQDVLDPRPETETLIECALSAPFKRVLDLGTGSGAIVVTLLAERPDAQGQGTDISDAALAVAARNAKSCGVTDRLRLDRSDWFAQVSGRYDLIVSNPPYIAPDEMPDLSPEVRLHDPEIALTDGVDGLDAYRALSRNAADHLTPGGRILLEIGPTQGAQVSEILQDVGFQNISVLPDLDQRDRVVRAFSPENT